MTDKLKDPLSESKLSANVKLIDEDTPDDIEPDSLIDALELSLAKWHPSRVDHRGVAVRRTDPGSCGLCCMYLDKECVGCPIETIGISDRYDSACVSKGHPFLNWCNSDDKFEAAEVVYQLILSAYWKEVGK